MAENRKSLGNIVDEFETSGKLSPEEASSIRDAPIWVIPFAEISAYLGGTIVFVGLVWIVSALLRDMSHNSIDAMLFIVAIVTAFVARWTISRGGKLVNLGECIVAVSVTSLAIAVGLFLDIYNVDEDLILLLSSFLALCIGLVLSRRTHFVGTVVVVVATQPFTAGLISNSMNDSPEAALLFALSGAALLWYSIKKIELKVFARAVGALSVMLASIAYSSFDNTPWRSLVGLVIAGCLFAYGAKVLHLEVVAAGGIGVTVAVGVLAGRLFDSPLIQGLSVIAVGAIVSTMAVAIPKRARRATKD